MAQKVSTSILYYLLLATCILSSVEGLECLKCLGLSATLDGKANDETTNILDVNNELVKLIGFRSLEEDCLSSDQGVLEQYKGAETCTIGQKCAVQNTSLTNENYKNQGYLKMTMVVRSCFVSKKTRVYVTKVFAIQVLLQLRMIM